MIATYKLVALILAAAVALVIVGFGMPLLFNGYEASQSCMLYESLIADISGGTLQTC